MAASPRSVVIAVCGSPAAGKTTLATAIATALHLPLLTRDELAAGLRLGAGATASADHLRSAAEKAMTSAAERLASSGVSLVLESSVLDKSHLAPLVDEGACILVVHVAAPPATIGLRLRERVDAGDLAMQRLLDQHQSGVLRPELFAPWDGASTLVTIDTSGGRSVAEHTDLVLQALHELRASSMVDVPYWDA